jgi:hypothetical protein
VKNIDFRVTYVTYLFKRKEMTCLNLPSFEVNFNSKQYRNLISMKDIFVAEELEVDLIESLKRDRMAIEQNKTFSGGIRKRGGELEKLVSFDGVLSG